jgi:hypothetical protein
VVKRPSGDDSDSVGNCQNSSVPGPILKVRLKRFVVSAALLLVGGLGICSY